MRKLVYYSDLLTNLVGRDIKLHYRRSVLGILWSQINPLLSLIIFSIVFEQIVPLGVPNYPAYVFTGLLAWNWFSTSLNAASYSLSMSRDLVRKPRFPTEMIVVSTVTTNMVNFFLSLPVLVGLLWLSNIPFSWALLFFPLIVAIQFILTLGLTLLISATNVFFLDIQHVVTILVLVWFYITPVFYRVNKHSDFDFLLDWNPMAQLLKQYRQIILNGSTPDFFILGWLTLGSSLIIGLGWKLFNQLKYRFVDEL